jgi:hypothetical protein
MRRSWYRGAFQEGADADIQEGWSTFPNPAPNTSVCLSQTEPRTEPGTGMAEPFPHLPTSGSYWTARMMFSFSPALASVAQIWNSSIVKQSLEWRPERGATHASPLLGSRLLQLPHRILRESDMRRQTFAARDWLPSDTHSAVSLLRQQCNSIQGLHAIHLGRDEENQ